MSELRGWKVLVLEDDLTVGRVHCRLVADSGGLDMIGLARTHAQGARMVRELKPDLVLLDFGLPGGGGLALLRSMRADRLPIEVIAVTATASIDVVRTTLHLGVLDYLVKPFEPDRLRRALHQFKRRMSLLNVGVVPQPAVDALRGTAAPATRWIPKGLSPERLANVRTALREAGEPVAADDVAQTAGIARVTARRYLEYLVTIGEASWLATGTGPGRPRKGYELGPDAPVADRASDAR